MESIFQSSASPGWWSSDAPTVLAHTIAIVALLVGMGLLLAGGKVLRPGMGLLGTALGALAGLSIAAALAPGTWEGVPIPAIGGLLGGVVGLVGALLLFRLTIALAAAGTLGGAAVLGAILWVSPHTPIEPSRLTSNWTTTSAAQAWQQVRTDVSSIGADRPSSLATTARATARSTAQDWWHSYTPEDRLRILGLAIIGTVGGFVLGALFPQRTSMLITAALGAWLVIAGLAWLILALKLPGRDTLEAASAAKILVAWAAAALSGLIVQTTGTKSPAPAPTPATA